ncbi:hypothetical protein Syun_008868 [Stephania yunnanensis]|uniref:Uncharacterized protein n=1 Tax=Stephania yunnanensis TaxID=152371 RepID=A0AAP0KFC5_9MAGN
MAESEQQNCRTADIRVDRVDDGQITKSTDSTPYRETHKQRCHIAQAGEHQGADWVWCPTAEAADLVWVSSGGAGVANDSSARLGGATRIASYVDGQHPQDVEVRSRRIGRQQWRSRFAGSGATCGRAAAGAERMCSSSNRTGEQATIAAKDDTMTTTARTTSTNPRLRPKLADSEEVEAWTTSTTELVEGAAAANPASARGLDWKLEDGVERMTSAGARGQMEAARFSVGCAGAWQRCASHNREDIVVSQKIERDTTNWSST